MLALAGGTLYEGKRLMENFMSQSKNSKKILKNFNRKEIIIHSGLKIHRFGI
jgi:hypothetical protein